MGTIGYLNAEEKGLILKTYPAIIPKDLEDLPSPQAPVPRCIRTLISKFPKVFPEDLPNGLPPLRTIQHEINFHTDAIIPNKAAYRMNLKEHELLQKEVNLFSQERVYP